MRARTWLAVVVVAAVGLAGCSTGSRSNADRVVAHPTGPAIVSPSGGARGGADFGPPRLERADVISYQASGPFPVDLGLVPIGVYDPNNQLDSGRWVDRIESPVSAEEAERMRQASLLLPPNENIDWIVGARGGDGVGSEAPVAGSGFASLDYTECCGGGGNVPPDPELAVGPNHIVAVVNVAFEVYDKSGALLAGPITFSSFFSGTPGCTSAGVFDPNVLYDESADRFILGIDGNGTDYCIAATAGSSPLGTWNRYGFATDVGGDFFDYPHAGVGRDAIYMGANLFDNIFGFFVEARVWAFDKVALYAGASAPAVVTRSTGGDDTPQPMNLHGFQQGTWPSSGPHYFISNRNFNGRTYGVYSWQDPFGANVFSNRGAVDLVAATGVDAGMPVDVPQNGAGLIQANDFRPQDAEYRNGAIWTVQTIACNPGAGTVNCIRWAQIDPAGPTVLDAGVFASDGDYRFFGDLAVNHCDDMGVGYSKSNGGMFPAVWATGRESGDPPGTVQGEVQLKAGELAYTAFDRSPRRWGDYTGLTIDPDGTTFWYLGEYSKDTGTTSGRWGTWVGSFSFAGCGGQPTVCGNGIIEPGETCDPGDPGQNIRPDLGGATCGDFGCTGGGVLGCSVSCDSFDTASCLDCPVCDNNGVCDLGEDCSSCPADCVSGAIPAAVCGNGICEAADGEDCVTCPADCNGVQTGKPSGRFCCGFGGVNPLGCDDARCTSGGFACTEVPSQAGGSFCCGDGLCDPGESCANCALDCAFGIEDSCSDGIDNDCNGLVDCDDPACDLDPACAGCTLGQTGDPCTTDADCCSSKCRGRTGAMTCR